MKPFPLLTRTLFIALLFIASACVPAVQIGPAETAKLPANPQPTATPTPADTPTPVGQELRLTVRAPELLPATPGAAGAGRGLLTPEALNPPVTGEAPASLLEDIRADLIERSGDAPEEIVVIRDQSVTWSDGSLGCQQPGRYYTDALVPGYWVVMQVGETQYDYRASEHGTFVLCEGGGVPFILPRDK